ncbi:MAG: YfhO family protein [Lachnospiraceae bacterium]
MKTKFGNKTGYHCIVSFCTTFLILMVLYKLYSFAPFGEKSLASMDANIQYLDFFSYFKDVLSGKNSLLYSFGKTLGGSNIAVYSYYLSSPFNFLVLLFDKTRLHDFFDILFAIKSAMAACTFSIFLSERFRNMQHKDIYRNGSIVVLSVSYALSQYCIAQSSNIMWLDGVYMLPLILLGTYRIVQDGKSRLLSISVALSILFNWYTGGINCLFSIFWLFFELLLLRSENTAFPVTDVIKKIVRYGYSMALGVFMSAVLFLPTIASLQNSSRGSMDLRSLFDFSLIGHISTLIENYSFGAQSAYGSVSLFCGSMALIGLIGCLTSKIISVRKRILFGFMFAVMILMFYWNPFVVCFSLFKGVGSYWYRYSYVGIALILFLACHFYMAADFKHQQSALIKISLAASFAIILVNYRKGNPNIHLVYASVLSLIFISCAISLINYCRDKAQIYRFISLIFAAVLITAELFYSTRLQMAHYSTADSPVFSAYVTEAEKQIAEINDFDQSCYRISQTSTRNMRSNQLTPYYNDALAYNYRSISGYTSSPDDIQRTFLDRLGYRINGENMCIVNTSILGADSLLGVKYILSGYPINGLKQVDSLEQYNGKYTYQNPYALPFAFVYTESENTADTGNNPFEYQNSLYSQLIGEEILLYVPLDYRITQKGNTSAGTSLIYSVDIPDGNYAVYGNLPWNSQLNATLNLNHSFETAYSCWLSPSVFYIPTDSRDTEAVLELRSETSYDVKYGEEQFYALNLDELAKAAALLSDRAADHISLKNGYAKISVNASENQRLFVSIPYDKGWKITLNGKETEPELFGECMYSIDLHDGTNTIEMVYHTPYLMEGTFVSLAGILLLVIIQLPEKRYHYFSVSL